EAGRKKVKTALCEWQGQWKEENIFERFDAISDDAMTTELWHLGSRARKSFGASADAIASVSGGTMDVEAALRMIQEAFSASQDDFKVLSGELAKLRTELEVIPLRSAVKREITRYEVTEDPSIEGLRVQIENILNESNSQAFANNKTELETQ